MIGLIKMAKLYFKYGAMGSSKTAQLLITKFNYEEKSMKTWLIKPSTDTRDGADIIKSRIGLNAKADAIIKPIDIILLMFEQVIAANRNIDVILVDEAQFLTSLQIEQLHDIVDKYNIPVICFGLLTDFQTHFFEGSKRLLEIAESITEIKTICKCGRKATVNARIDKDGRIVKDGNIVQLGGNDTYESMCYKCWKDRILAEETEKERFK